MLKKRETTIKTSGQAENISVEINIETVFNVAPVGMILVDSDGRINKVNQAITQLIGKEHTELFERKLGEGIGCINSQILQGCGMSNACFACHLRKAFENVITTGSGLTNVEIEKTLIINDAHHHFYFSVNAGLIETNKKRYVLLAISDITETKNSYLKKIEEKNALLSALLNSIPDIVFFKDKNGTYLGCNPQFCKLVGRDYNDIIGKNDYDFFDKDIADFFREKDMITFERSGISQNEESVTYPDGHTAFLETIKAPLINDQGEKIGIVGISRNITDRKEASNKLRETMEKANQLAMIADSANKAKSQFLANMSHELRTPLNSILGFTEMLVEEDMNSKQRELIEIVNSQGHLLLQLVNDILDFSVIDAGKLKMEFTECNLSDLLSQTNSIFGKNAAEKGLDFKVSSDPQLPEIIKTDPARLNQCIVNLTNNAIKFTDKGHVYLNASPETINGKLYIRFDVEDTGIGISTEDSEKVFDMFMQGDSSHSRKYGGAGLGLAITKDLAKMLGGTLEFESEQGKGSIFRLTIAADTEAKTPEKIKSTTDGHIKFNADILIVDDSAMNRKVMQMMLNKTGLRVHMAEDGLVALEKLSQIPFDLIIMDIQMPNMNGYDTTKAIRDRGIKIPIIAVTANALKDDRAKCISAGCNDYMAKPVDKHKLTQLISQHLK